jgi:hypothetical protein
MPPIALPRRVNVGLPESAHGAQKIRLGIVFLFRFLIEAKKKGDHLE